jgi:ABC-type antimicrobial peptide transport system permease subunit
MKLPGVIGTAVEALRRNIVRSLLTTLGIVIGVAAVITMMEIGNGATLAIQRTLSSIGANTLAVIPGAQTFGGISFGIGSMTTLTPNDADSILARSPAIANVAPIVRARTQIVFGNRNWVPTYVYGTTPAFLMVRDWNQLDEGAAFTDRDVRNASKVCLVGHTIVRELFAGESPIGKEVRVRNVAFKVIGVLSLKGANMMGQDQDDILLAPWTTIKYRVVATSLTAGNQSATNTANSTEVNSLSQLYPNIATSLYPTPSSNELADLPQPVRFANVDQILANARSPGDVPAAISQVTATLRETHHLRADAPNDFTVRDMTEITKAMSATTHLVTRLLLYVAMISLVVGGVGIMNIMLVSVTERTREIGLRMAVGAEPTDILRQFLAEALVICLFGGILGTLTGRGASLLVSSLFGWPTVPSLGAVVAAVAVSASVGLIFGFYPAWKGSRLDPIDALRSE